MEAPQDGEYYWGTLINADKSAAPLLEQLCLGLVQLMEVQFDSSCGSSSDLTPDKLARFYRKVGGNYDALFLETKGPALSFIYQALGCFHTLQPTKNPYEAPSIPALLPMGFVRWQVIQLLLCPDEHWQYLQQALCQWDIPNPAGGIFPKTIPRTAFPETADADMLRWHEKVSRRLAKDHALWNTPPQPQPHTSFGDSGYRKAGDSVHRRTYFDTDDETLRQHYRRRSQDAERSRLHRFDTGPDARTSSRNPSPTQNRSSSTARMPMRSKTMRARSNREYPEKANAKKDKKKEKKQYRKQQSDSSDDDEDGVLPRPPRRSYHLSPPHETDSQRRHSHDASYYKTRDRDYRDYSNSSKKESSRYPPSKMKFYENMFDEPATGNIPRAHVRSSDGPPPVDTRGSTLSNGSGSSGGSDRDRDRDRPRSSSGPASWMPWNRTKKAPVYN